MVRSDEVDVPAPQAPPEFVAILRVADRRGALETRVPIVDAGRVEQVAAVLASVVAIGVIGVVTMQTGWLLRPFVARPPVEVAFLRPVEEDVFSSLAATASAAAGVYQHWEAEPAGAVGEWQELQRTRRAR